MVYHANSDWLQGGFLGVEVFFVISGYLITLLLICEHEQTDRVDLKQFWFRRARRLLPALFVMLFMLTNMAMMSATDEPPAQVCSVDPIATSRSPLRRTPARRLIPTIAADATRRHGNDVNHINTFRNGSAAPDLHGCR